MSSRTDTSSFRFCLWAGSPKRIFRCIAFRAPPPAPRPALFSDHVTGLKSCDNQWPDFRTNFESKVPAKQQLWKSCSGKNSKRLIFLWKSYSGKKFKALEIFRKIQNGIVEWRNDIRPSTALRVNKENCPRVCIVFSCSIKAGWVVWFPDLWLTLESCIFRAIAAYWCILFNSARPERRPLRILRDPGRNNTPPNWWRHTANDDFILITMTSYR